MPQLGNNWNSVLGGLRIGEEASILHNTPHIGQNGQLQVDADLIRKMPDNSLHKVDHVHLNPGSLTEQR